jgi:hypothetical protein
MGPKELTFKGDDQVKCFACSECGQLYGLLSRDQAMRCCNWRCDTCGEKTSNFRTTCNGCQDAQKSIRDVERYEKAKKILWQDYQGMMFRDGEYFQDLDDVDSHYGDERPDYVYATVRIDLKFDAGGVLGEALSAAYDDAYDDLRQSEIDRLQKLLDEWCEMQGMHWFESNESVAVILPEIEREEDTE